MIQVTAYNADEYEAHLWVTEASTLGLRPGEYPNFLKTTLGNGRNFVLKSAEYNDGDITVLRYEQHSGCISLHVYND